MTRKSVALISVQLLCIAVLVATGPLIPYGTGPVLTAAAGMLIILWAAQALGFGNVRVQPELPEHAQLTTRGPYRWVRHPMYTGVMLIAAAWLWDRFTLLRLAVAVVLAADFVVKLLYEEELLRERFPGYAEYMTRTKRLVPGVW